MQNITMETDPNGIEQHKPGAKMDGRKIDMSFLQSMSNALRAVCVIFEYGQLKYTRDGWLQVPNGQQRYLSACLRHLLPEDDLVDDRESHLLHLAHAAWNILASLELYLLEKQNALIDMKSLVEELKVDKEWENG